MALDGREHISVSPYPTRKKYKTGRAQRHAEAVIRWNAQNRCRLPARGCWPMTSCTTAIRSALTWIKQIGVLEKIARQHPTTR